MSCCNRAGGTGPADPATARAIFSVCLNYHSFYETKVDGQYEQKWVGN